MSHRCIIAQFHEATLQRLRSASEEFGSESRLMGWKANVRVKGRQRGIWSYRGHVREDREHHGKLID